MKRKMCSLLFAIMMLLSSTCFASASEERVDTETPYFILYSEDGEILEYNMPVSLGNARAEDGTYLKKIYVTSGYETKKDCGYHPSTSIWRNTAAYYLSESNTVTVGVNFSASGVSYSISLGVSATSSTVTTIVIPADVSRQSKLRVYCDFDYDLYIGEVRDINTDELYYTFQFAEATKTGEFFNPEYKP